MTEIENVIMNMSGANRESANLIANSILDILERDGCLATEEDVLKKFLIEKLEPAATCPGHDEDSLDMFMEITWELRHRFNHYPEGYNG